MQAASSDAADLLTSPTIEQASDLLTSPTIEQAQLLLANCPDFTTALALMAVNKHWATCVAEDDSSFLPLTALIATEARLHYDSSTKKTDSTWRSECKALFASRGTFISAFGGQPTPPPTLEPFAISVGCRFRPAGATTSSEAAKEMILPLHQRLRLIQSSHGCSLGEARKILWSGEASSAADPWARSAAATSDKENRAVADVSDAVADKGASAGAAAEAEERPAEEEAADSSTPHVVGGGTTDAAAGLIALRGGSAIICAPGAGLRAFDFDHAWGEASRQDEVYNAAVAPLVADVINGRSACVLAYGQTGSGKTYSMTGPSGSGGGRPREEDLGLIPRAVRSVLEACEHRESTLGVAFKASVACIEVFGDLVTDLLHAGGGGGGGGGGQGGSNDDGNDGGGGGGGGHAAGHGGAHGGGHGGVGGFWQGVSAAATAAGYADVCIDSFEGAMDLLQQADLAKRRAATLMNERSSRAHSLIMITLEQEARPGEGKVKSTLCLCDLGGCEKVKKSNVVGERLLEAIHINQGLLALKSVITALNQRKSYVPYQDSKLTYLLKRSLAGGARTYVLLGARPEAEHATETLQALRFGEACSQVEVSASMGTGADRAAALALESLDEQIDALEATIREKERFETRVVKVKDERAGLAVTGEDGESYFSGLTDFATYEKKISVIVGAEKERRQLEKLISQRRGLTGSEK